MNVNLPEPRFGRPGLRTLLTLAAVFAAPSLLAAGCSGSTKKGTKKPGPAGKPTARPEAPVEYVQKTLALKKGDQSVPTGKPAPILAILKKALDHNLKNLKDKDSPPPYYLAYTATATQHVNASAVLGGLTSKSKSRSRRLTVDLRMGSHKFDNTHFKERGWGAYGGQLPLEDNEAAVRQAVWLATDRVYKRARQELSRVKAKAKTQSKEEDPSDDFSFAPKLRIIGKPAVLTVNQKMWEKRMRAASAVFRRYPWLRSSSASFSAWAATRYYVSSDGTVLQLPTVRYRVTIQAGAMAKDGMTFRRHESEFSPTEDGLPGEAKLKEMAEKVVKDLAALRKAPLAHPFEGPAIFQGKAAGVFFHEVFGHRMEGHRQKLERMDQTFTKKLGKQVMPKFLSVFDHPGLWSVNGKFLNGFYRVDDEGVRGARVDMVKNGILSDFLMSRTPIKTRPKSNGHGRRSYGMTAVARQGNLVVNPSRVVSYATLRKMLIAEAKKQGKAYGLVFKDVSGGFTFTHRFMPQAFKVMPIIVFRVYVDGRPDQLVRGVDLVGTPLLALTRIKAAANDFQTFNGMCGAESGWVPVSATSPSLLVTKIETQRKPTAKIKPPLLPPPKGDLRNRAEGR